MYVCRTRYTRRHIGRHQEERCVACSACPVKFSSPSLFSRHRSNTLRYAWAGRPGLLQGPRIVVACALCGELPQDGCAAHGSAARRPLLCEAKQDRPPACRTCSHIWLVNRDRTGVLNSGHSGCGRRTCSQEPFAEGTRGHGGCHCAPRRPRCRAGPGRVHDREEEKTYAPHSNALDRQKTMYRLVVRIL